MMVPAVLLFVSVAGVAAALWLPGGKDWVLLAGPCALASLYLPLRPPAGRKDAPRRSAGAEVHVVVEGSNVMHWDDETPRIEPVLHVVAELERRGLTPGVVFDANAGYRLTGRYQHHREMAGLLRLPIDRVMVVPKGTVADEAILRAAQDMNARIVTNDRYRDWAEAHPEVKRPGHLIRGGYRDGRTWLEEG